MTESIFTKISKKFHHLKIEKNNKYTVSKIYTLIPPLSLPV